jgi:hypothetical protein
MNLILTFVHPTKPPKTVGPLRAIRLDAESLRETANGTPVAVHREHQWEIQGQKYFRMDAATGVHCHFEHVTTDERSRDFGPYEQFSAVDGIAYVDDHVFAVVDEKDRDCDWFCYEDGHHWPVLIVTDAGTAARSRLLSLAGLAPLLPGVIALWQGAKLLYLGGAASLRSEVRRLADEWGTRDITAVTWEKHDDPAARKVELFAEYERGMSSLPRTYGRLHGNLVRTARLIEKATETIARSSSLLDCARMVCANLRPAAAYCGARTI